MQTFLLIVRILLVVGVFAGVILMFTAPTIAKAKKFGNEKVETHHMVKLKLIGFIIIASAIALLLIINLAN